MYDEMRRTSWRIEVGRGWRPWGLIGLSGVMMAALMAAVAMFPWGASAADDTDSAVTPLAGYQFEFHDLIVYGEATLLGGRILTPAELSSDDSVHLGESLEALVGVSMVRRSAAGTEPVMRGLGWERVRTQVGSVPLFGACPSRMDPPITYLTPNYVNRMIVTRGLASVTAGPGGLGGRIQVDPAYEPAGVSGGVRGWLGAQGSGGHDGWHGNGGLYGGWARGDFSVAVDSTHYDDFETGDGLTVPAGQDKTTAMASLGLVPAVDHRFWQAIRYVREENVDFPTLPMDTESTDLWLYNAGYRISHPGRYLDRIELSGGFSTIGHVMNNVNKPNRGMMEAETPSEADSYAMTLELDLRPAGGAMLKTGLNGLKLDRDAIRTRRLPQTGQTFTDHIWPEASQLNLGGFAELITPLSQTLYLRGGARVDWLRSEAAAADEMGMMGRTIAENYAMFYGTTGDDIDRDETLTAVNGQLDWEVASGWTAYAGTGYSMRGAAVTERYFAFAPAPGGFQVGNPGLDSEKKFELAGGIEAQRDRFALNASVYSYWLQDYVLPTVIDQRDVNQDGAIDKIFGFKNVDARIVGAELSGHVKLTRHLSTPFELAVTRGQNRTEDKPLAEMPALSGKIGAAISGGDAVRWWSDVELAFADRQTRFDESYGEDATAGYAIANFGVGLELANSLRVEARVGNLFDKAHHDHLNRSVALPVGDLAAGDPLPNPGRQVTVTTGWRW